MEEEHLHLLINEEIYLLSQDEVVKDFSQSQLEKVDMQSATSSTEKESERKAEENTVKEKEETSTPIETQQESKGLSHTEEVKQVVKEGEPMKTEETPAHIETKQESPEIPKHELEDPGEISFAVFHSSNNSTDIELLHKIIDACKLPENSYKIFGGGFDQSVHFKKALVFVPEAKAFYTPIPYKKSEFLCSKPLDQISGNVQEKAKLWGALQKFVDTI